MNESAIKRGDETHFKLYSLVYIYDLDNAIE